MADQNPTPPDPAGKPEGAAQPAAPGAEAMAEQALKAAQQAVSNLEKTVDPAGAASAPAGAASSPAPFEPQAFDRSEGGEQAKSIDLLSDVNLNVKIELGRTRMLVEDVLKLSEGAVVELDKLAGDPVDVYVNERHIARGEVLVLNDNFCVRINEIVRDGENEPVKR